MTVRLPLQLAVNGRFLTRPLSGVDRVAHEMLNALSRRLARQDPSPIRSMRVITPCGPLVAGGIPDDIPTSSTGRLRGSAWEQLELPRGLGDAALFSPCNVGPLSCRRQIVTIHDAQVYLMPRAYSRPFRTWYRWLLPRLGARAALVTTVSHYSRRMLEQFGVVPPGKAVVIHNGADHILRVRPDNAVLHRHGLEPGRFFLAIGSLSPHKNLKTAVEAAGRRRGPAMPLVVAGGSAAHVFADAGLRESEDVRFLGRVSDAELRALFDNATALVFPSLFEGFGLPALEAMNCGCPVIASDIPTLTEVCGDAVVYADPGEPAQWAKQMERLAESAELRATLAERGRRQAASFTWDRAADAMIEAIRQTEAVHT